MQELHILVTLSIIAPVEHSMQLVDEMQDTQLFGQDSQVLLTSLKCPILQPSQV